MQSEHIQQLGRVAAQRCVALADPVQEVEVFRLGKLLCFRNAGCEVVPGNNRFDGGEGITAALLGFKQSLTNPSIEPELVVDRFAVRLKLLLMLVLRRVEQLADDAVVQIDDLVGHGGRSFNRQRDQGGIAALRLELHQVGGGHLSAFARDLQADGSDESDARCRAEDRGPAGLEPVDMFEHVLGVRL